MQIGRLQSSFQKMEWEAGCDEAGRGSLAGPVLAASVILPTDFYHPGIQDSKQLSSQKREKMRHLIEKEAISFSIGCVEPKIIDEVNILQASIMAMHICLGKLRLKPSFLIIDGNYFIPYLHIPYQCIVRGDSRFLSIAAASILAKTYRDAYMEDLHEYYPKYDWKKNKGYPTLYHRNAIEKWGLSPEHRKSFRVKEL